MNKVEPCYCDQASEYEELLTDIVVYLSKLKLNQRRIKEKHALFVRIEDTLCKYQQAQKEYKSK